MTEKISGEELTGTILVKNQACWACPITCTRITKAKSDKEGEGPEFESAWAFGAQCGIDDPEAGLLGEEMIEYRKHSEAYEKW